MLQEKEYVQIRTQLLDAKITDPDQIERFLKEYEDLVLTLDIITNPKKYGIDGHESGECGPYHSHPIPWQVAKKVKAGESPRQFLPLKVKP